MAEIGTAYRTPVAPVILGGMFNAHGLESVTPTTTVSIEDALAGARIPVWCDSSVRTVIGACGDIPAEELPPPPVKQTFDPITITAIDSCWMGYTNEEMRSRAAAKLSRMLWPTLSAHLEHGTLTQSFTAQAAMPDPATPMTFDCAMGVAMEYAGVNGFDAVWHIPPKLAAFLPEDVKDRTGVLQAANGMRVAIGGGYNGTGPGGAAPENGMMWTYVTGPLWGYLSPVKSYEVGYRRDNIYYTSISQVATIAYACKPVAIPVKLECS